MVMNTNKRQATIEAIPIRKLMLMIGIPGSRAKAVLSQVQHQHLEMKLPKGGGQSTGTLIASANWRADLRAKVLATACSHRVQYKDIQMNTGTTVHVAWA